MDHHSIEALTLKSLTAVVARSMRACGCKDTDGWLLAGRDSSHRCSQTGAAPAGAQQTARAGADSTSGNRMPDSAAKRGQGRGGAKNGIRQLQEFVACWLLGKMTTNRSLHLKGRLVPASMRTPTAGCLPAGLHRPHRYWQTGMKKQTARAGAQFRPFA